MPWPIEVVPDDHLLNLRLGSSARASPESFRGKDRGVARDAAGKKLPIEDHLFEINALPASAGVAWKLKVGGHSSPRAVSKSY